MSKWDTIWPFIDRRLAIQTVKLIRELLADRKAWFPYTRKGSFIWYVRTIGGGGSGKSVRHAYKGKGAYTWEYVRKNIPFLHVFCDIFICWKLLPCFVVFGVDFHYLCVKHLL